MKLKALPHWKYINTPEEFVLEVVGIFNRVLTPILIAECMKKMKLKMVKK